MECLNWLSKRTYSFFFYKSTSLKKLVVLAYATTSLKFVTTFYEMWWNCTFFLLIDPLGKNSLLAKQTTIQRIGPKTKDEQKLSNKLKTKAQENQIAKQNKKQKPKMYVNEILDASSENSGSR